MYINLFTISSDVFAIMFNCISYHIKVVDGIFLDACLVDLILG